MRLDTQTWQEQGLETRSPGRTRGEISQDELAHQWSRVRGRLQEEIGEVEYRNWLRQAVLHGLDGDEVTVMLPTRFLRDWVNKEYGNLLTAFWQAENPAVRRVDIRTRPAGTSERAPDLAEVEPKTAIARPAAAARREAEERPDMSTPLDPRIPPEEKEKGNNTNSRAIIDACRPWHWRDKFPKVNMPSPETARRAMEKFGYLLK